MAVTGARLRAAGDALLAPADASPAALALLRALDCDVPAEPGERERQRARLFHAAGHFGRLFRLDSAAAPGLCCFGAEVTQDGIAGEAGLPPLSVAGSGPDAMAAFESCVGEAIERLSVIETRADRDLIQPPPAMPEPWLASLLAETPGDPGWWPTRRAADGATVLVPVDLCLRRHPDRRAFPAPWPLSNGCAAGPDRESATLRALLELIERDAAALWWRGGRPPAPLPLEVAAAAVALLARLRDGAAARRTWLLDITTDLGIPVVAAVSFAAAGAGFCFGLAARPTAAAAASAALLELAQIELAIEVVAAKRQERGEAALNDTDRQHQRRFDAIDASCDRVQPRGAPREPRGPPPATAASVLETLHRHGFAPLLVDLTRPVFGVPVIRALCPGLETEPSRLDGARLAAMREADTDQGRLPAVPLM